MSYFPIAYADPAIDGWPEVLLDGREGKTLSDLSAFGRESSGTTAGYGTLLEYARPGFEARLLGQFGRDFYERLHLSTALLALGNVIGLQQRVVSVWNAFTRAQPLAAITPLGAEGITIDGAPALPFIFKPLEEQVYTVSVAAVGPPNILASYTFDFGPYDLVLRITGSRVIAWSFVPDWTAGITERIEWKTDVIQSFNAREQRGAARAVPRKSYEFEALVNDDAKRYAESLLWGWGARPWALPIWPDGADLGAPLAGGSTTIPTDTTTRDYAPGSLAVLLRDTFTFEVVEVQAVTPTALQLVRPTTGAWLASDRIFPARLARLQDRVGLDRWDGRASTTRVRFDIDEPVPYPPDLGTTIYRTRPVLTRKPDWSGGFDFELARKLAELDSITGPRYLDDEAGIPIPSQRMRWALYSRADQEAFRRLLYALQGRRGSAWVPSWTDDLTVVAQVPNSAAFVDVEATQYSLQVVQSPNRRDLRVQLRSGAIFYRRITGSSQVSQGVERLAIDAPFGVTLQPDDFEQLSFMMLARLDGDGVELSHWTGDACESATLFKGFRSDL